MISVEEGGEKLIIQDTTLIAFRQDKNAPICFGYISKKIIKDDTIVGFIAYATKKNINPGATLKPPYHWQNKIDYTKDFILTMDFDVTLATKTNDESKLAWLQTEDYRWFKTTDLNLLCRACFENEAVPGNLEYYQDNLDNCICHRLIVPPPIYFRYHRTAAWLSERRNAASLRNE